MDLYFTKRSISKILPPLRTMQPSQNFNMYLQHWPGLRREGVIFFVQLQYCNKLPKKSYEPSKKKYAKEFLKIIEYLQKDNNLVFKFLKLDVNSPLL